MGGFILQVNISKSWIPFFKGMTEKGTGMTEKAKE